MTYKYIIKVEYDGSTFNGYGTQPHQNTIQDNLEKVLTMINSNQKVKTFATSRTDAKVHAYMQIVQFSLNKEFEIHNLKNKLNKMLKEQINVLEIIKDYQDLINVRYDVINKTYIYKVMQSKSPFYLNYALYFPELLAVDQMLEATKYLIGTHNFTSFCNKNTDVINKIRTINYIKIYQKIENNLTILYFEVNGNGFLYNMVRLIVGTLLMVGSNKYPSKKVQELLLQKKRTKECVLAPAHGLYLKEINYKQNFFKR
ncbi:MAG: tRNA pseudouridine(38-40) synthase TruA [Mycoplasmatales bacterium]